MSAPVLHLEFPVERESYSTIANNQPIPVTVALAVDIEEESFDTDGSVRPCSDLESWAAYPAMTVDL